METACVGYITIALLRIKIDACTLLQMLYPVCVLMSTGYIEGLKAQTVGHMSTCILLRGLCMCRAWSRYKMWVVGVEVRLRNEAAAGVGHT